MDKRDDTESRWCDADVVVNDALRKVKSSPPISKSSSSQFSMASSTAALGGASVNCSILFDSALSKHTENGASAESFPKVWLEAQRTLLRQ